MHKLFAAALATATMSMISGTAHAEGLTITGNLALTTDYEFRGFSQTQHDPAIQGGFDLTDGDFYAGIWASNVDFGSSVHVPMELDLYAGWRPKIGPVSADFGVIAYTYPSAHDTGFGDWTYYEAKAADSIPVTPALALGAAVYWTPEWAQRGGDGLYTELNGSWAVNDSLSVSGAVGYVQANPDSSDYPDGYFVHRSGGGTNNYTTYNIGATYTTRGFAIDLRYVGNSESDLVLFSPTEVTDNAVLLTVKRAL
jgi:uncharacterized protein (TIGR02001 family)